MGFDPTKVGDGNITNVVIQSRYTLLDLKANALEKRLKIGIIRKQKEVEMWLKNENTGVS